MLMFSFLGSFSTTLWGGGTDPNCKRAGSPGSGIVVVRYKSDVALLQGGSVKVVNGALAQPVFAGVQVRYVQENEGTKNEDQCVKKSWNSWSLQHYVALFFPTTDLQKSLRVAQGEQIHTFTEGTETLKFAWAGEQPELKVDIAIGLAHGSHGRLLLPCFTIDDLQWWQYKMWIHNLAHLLQRAELQVATKTFRNWK